MLNNSLGYCGIIVYPFSAVLVAIMEYTWIRTGQIFHLIFLIPVIGSNIFLCLSGQSFENTYESLVKTVLDLPWYEMSPEMKRNYRILLAQIQVPLRYKGEPLFDFNAQFLTYYLKGSYTLSNFFVNFKN
ncbi:uncharacterized protein LOC123322806 [Coccinella septempunctata]|uniref:uncharacterized protein LOC123322806 n=1 Tax=Coccinella septempunctata TaxID=41139 RepID=UPI001D06525D|nr:uncharacterized protein LOC123322806 [Coccinella septempunctata]